MPITPEDFKGLMSQYPSGVTVITVKSGDDVHGLTASAFASVSPNPPLIAVFIDHRGYGHELLQRSDAVFAVNFLRAEQEELANRFAFSKEDRFAEGNWTTAVTGAPLLEDAVAWMDCTVYSRHTAGNNTIYIGEIQASKIVTPDASPLLYWNRGYRTLNGVE
jgi:flavin reductase (DIM6/NTAB) family NADH-FMN oxidoreductase RutF